MPEKNKHSTAGEEVTEECTTDRECADTGRADENDVSTDETDGGALAVDNEGNADSADADASGEALPCAHISEDGDQLTLAIPTSVGASEDTDESETDASDETEGFTAALLKEAPPYDEKKPRKIDDRFDFIELLIFTLAAVFVLTSFVFRHSIVDGNSMQNTLQDGEILIISGLFYTPERYDIVVVEDYSTGIDHPIVKRVIATEGETVKITSEGKIFVDGEEISDYFVFTDAGDLDGDGKDDYTYSPMEYTVPEGEIFVLGDHRNDSYDSRRFGGVDADAVLGKVLFRIYPFNRFGSVYGGAEE